MAKKKAPVRPRRARTVKKAPAARKRASTAFPDRIYGIASPRSIGGVSLFESGAMADAQTVGNFLSDEAVIQEAALRLQSAGFEVLQLTPIMINIVGSRSTYEQAFGVSLAAEERPTMKEQGRDETATFFSPAEATTSGLISTVGTAFEDVLEGVAIEEPRYLMAPSAFPPAKGYWHLDVPAGISLGCNADRVHRDGITGRGVRVAMVDTGWYRHPFFEERGYRVAPVTLGPGTADPLKDEVGHGTGESANIFAVAPDVELLPVKALLAGSENTVLVNVTAAFNAAVGLQPDIITCSWGFDIETGPLSAAQQALAAAVAAAVSSGIVVIFSAGNGQAGFPGQHPDVISAGGAYLDQKGALEASDYASGFISQIYPGRRVPDLCGLVGLLPKAAYIMLPVEPGDMLDKQLAGGTHPNGDETTNSDGWAAFSGTSAAAPQLAGAAALIKQACPRLSPPAVKDILMKTARDVTTGRNHPRFDQQAVVGPDTATGNGLVDARKAVLIAKLRCLTFPAPAGPQGVDVTAGGQPILPIHIPPLQPLQPLRPLLPLFPLHPLLPLQPLQPLHPIHPLLPLLPLHPLVPLHPIHPLHPLLPLQPVHPLQPLQPLHPIHPLLPLQPLHPLVPLQPIHPLLPLLPVHPLLPLQPLHPLVPLFPLTPLTPLRPLLPLVPLRPLLPLRPLVPLLPLRPLVPIGPIGPDPGPLGPGGGTFSGAMSQGGATLSESDLRQLEEIIIQSKGDNPLS